jgi:phosphoribosylformimino-5-aminoimidazole carboxamide ribotide isomerase
MIWFITISMAKSCGGRLVHQRNRRFCFVPADLRDEQLLLFIRVLLIFLSFHVSAAGGSVNAMLLLIPAIEIKRGRCVQMVQGEEGFVYSDDPVEMARLWRLENAKTLHVTDIDGRESGRIINDDCIKKMVERVDIPIELGGGLRTFDEVQKAFDLGMYRAVVGSALLENPAESRRVIEKFGASRVVLGIDAMDGLEIDPTGKTITGRTAVEAALVARDLGFKRVLYTNVKVEGTFRGVNLEILRDLAVQTGLRVTSSGGLAGLEDLMKIQQLESLGVDSVIVGRALYENKFSCQGLWRRCEAGGFPYTAKV